ncbi:TasA family protein [Bacillus sp. V5-8f]|uniref:TasA family protein n=1 Tax=Bacillus sp. V5-8f TaxID=2053044 RepID=UPI000C77D739|nr:TasA family protein [Bacillus sp. V5-8f]PLT35577.1 hypothetical protein CUU64_02940 [Bacillus sp. V5-8f]
MSVKKKIGGALLGTALGAALIGGGTFALFISSATNAGNTAEAGTLTIEDITDGDAAAFTVTDMAPGDSGSGTVTIQNTGSLDAWVKIDSIADTGDLAPALNVTTTNTAPVIIKAGESADFTVNYDLPIGTGNDYQGDNADLDVVFKAVQSKNNGDTNGNGVADAGETPTSWNENAQP